MNGVGWCRGVEGEFAVSMCLYACLGARGTYLDAGYFVLLLRHGGIGCLMVNLFEFVKCECDAVLFGGQVDNSVFVESVSMLQFRVHSEQMCQPFFSGTTAKKSSDEYVVKITKHGYFLALAIIKMTIAMQAAMMSMLEVLGRSS